MSEFFAEATVRLRPNLTGFINELRTELKAAIGAVETGARAPRIRIRPALPANFVSDLRQQVNAAVAQAQRGVKPIRVRAEIADFPRGQLREISRRSVAGAAGGAAGGAAFGGIAAGAQQADAAALGLLRTEKLLNSAFGQSATLIGTVTTAQDASTKARARGAKTGLEIVRSTVVESAATKALTQARRALATVEIAAEGTRSRTLAIRRAEAVILSTLVIAEEQHAIAVKADAQAMLTRLQILDANNAALQKLSTTTARAARSQEQLRRGAVATSLSFLGIRGATLAASASFLAGAAAIAIFAKALQSASAFQVTLNVFRATTAATGEELERVREAARALGADIRLPGVTAADAAESMLELAKAGLGVQDSIEGARGVLLLATAAAIGNAQAVELAANALNAFQLQGRDATRVADVFANAANAAQGSIVDIGIAFQQAAAAGRQVGLSFEDTSTFLTILAQNGLKGSDAGTSLRTALIRLIKPTDEAAAKLKKLGVEIRDARGNVRPDIFIQLTEAVKDLSPAARDAVIALVGGQDAFRALSILGRQSIEDFIKLRRELRQQGTAAEIAAARNEGLRGSVDALGSTLSTAGTRIGQGVTPSIQGLVASLTAGTAALAASSTVAATFAGVMDSVNLATSALGGTLAVIGPPLVAIAGAFGAVTNAVGVPALLAALATYKLFPIVLSAATAGFVALRASTLAASVAMFAGVRTAADLKVATSLLAGAFNPLTLGIAAAAAGLVFLITRESAAERATRQLAEATQGLVRAQEALRSAQTQRRDTGLGVNAAQLAVLEARQAAAAARGALANTSAARGAFARTKIELELAVAVDNVAIAENRYRDAITAASDARDEAIQAARNAKDATVDQIRSIEKLVQAERNRARAVGRGGRGGRGAAALQEALAVQRVTSELVKRAQAARAENTAESRALARRLELIAGVSDALKRLPTDKAIEIAINATSAEQALDGLVEQFAVKGAAAREALISAVTGIAADQLAAALKNLVNTVGRSFEEAMGNLGTRAGDRLIDRSADSILAGAAKVMAAVSNVVARAGGQLQGLERQALDISIASGSDAQVLANLKAQEATARQILAAQQKAFAAGKIAEESVRRAQEQLNNIVQQRRALQERLAADAKSAARDAKQKQEDIDNDLLEALGIKRDTGQERITDAQISEGLRDDIRRTRDLRQLVIRQIALVRDQIKTASIRIDAIRELKRILRDLAREIDSLRKQRLEEIQSRIAEANQLDIEFASITENESAEIRARQREIARLKKLQALTKGDILERKRLRNLIAEQQKAIEDLRKKSKERNDAFRRLTFEFLQRQQGFATNLLGNLIPGGATAGLVGAVSPAGGSGPIDFGPTLGTGRGPDGGKRPIELGVAAGAAAGGVAGPTRGQASVEIQLLRQIVRILERMDKGSGHPEAKNAKRLGSSVMDVM